MAHPALERWHRAIANGNRPEDLTAIVAADAVFHSPVVHTPQVGRAKVVAYLAAAGQVLGGDGFRYVREFAVGDLALLEFEAELDGIHVNGIDLITFGADGKITDFKVMVRPLKALNKVRELMGARLAAI